MRLELGLSLTPEADRADELVALAQVADRGGLDPLGIQDHPYQRRFLDTWTLLSVLARRTERIRLFPNVAALADRLFELDWIRRRPAPRAVRVMPRGEAGLRDALDVAGAGALALAA